MNIYISEGREIIVPKSVAMREEVGILYLTEPQAADGNGYQLCDDPESIFRIATYHRVVFYVDLDTVRIQCYRHPNGSPSGHQMFGDVTLSDLALSPRAAWAWIAMMAKAVARL